jgi:hypothetical protein
LKVEELGMRKAGRRGGREESEGLKVEGRRSKVGILMKRNAEALRSRREVGREENHGWTRMDTDEVAYKALPDAIGAVGECRVRSEKWKRASRGCFLGEFVLALGGLGREGSGLVRFFSFFNSPFVEGFSRESGGPP